MYEKIDGCGRGQISLFGPYKKVGYRHEFMCYFYEILEMSYRD